VPTDRVPWIVYSISSEIFLYCVQILYFIVLYLIFVQINRYLKELAQTLINILHIIYH